MHRVIQRRAIRLSVLTTARRGESGFRTTAVVDNEKPRLIGSPGGAFLLNSAPLRTTIDNGSGKFPKF